MDNKEPDMNGEKWTHVTKELPFKEGQFCQRWCIVAIPRDKSPSEDLWPTEYVVAWFNPASGWKDMDGNPLEGVSQWKNFEGLE